MPAAPELTPPPAPRPPVFTRDAFAALTGIAGILAELADDLKEGAAIPVAHARVEQVVVGARQALVLVAKSLEDLPDEQLFGWAARIADLAALASMVTHDAMAVLHMRAAAAPAIVGIDGRPAGAEPVLVGPDMRPVSAPRPRPTLPLHLQEVVAALHAPPAPAFRAPDFIKVEMLGPDRVRVGCTVCGLAAGEVGADVAQAVIDTHIRARHRGERVEWLHPTVPDPGPGPYDQPTCRRCYCTPDNACAKVIESTDEGVAPITCSWHELNPETNAGVCSACAE